MTVGSTELKRSEGISFSIMGLRSQLAYLILRESRYVDSTVIGKEVLLEKGLK